MKRRQAAPIRGEVTLTMTADVDIATGTWLILGNDQRVLVVGHKSRHVLLVRSPTPWETTWRTFVIWLGSRPVVLATIIVCFMILLWLAFWVIR